ncbi:MAG: polyprenol phosphomannose-dependent alpha 1,6 mannosyltransferase MptB [Dehalococcoidia bacterium]
MLAALPVLFAGTLWFMLPVSSQDVYHYTMEGRLFSVHGANPLTTPPAAYPADPLAWTVRAWSDTPSRYGPLFALVAAGVTRATGDSLTATLLGFKLLMTAALFGTAALAYFTVRRIDPAAALPAYVFVAWNPLALYEAAANAHNDLLMVLFTALALYLWLRGRLDLALPRSRWAPW